MSTQVPQFANHKVKIKVPGQRACNEKDEKGKLCAGHLKRWFYSSDFAERKCGDIQQALGPDAEVYRCSDCKTLYVPGPDEARGVNVAGVGMISKVPDLTPKEAAPPTEAKETKTPE